HSVDSAIVVRGMKHFHDKLKSILGQWTDVHKFKDHFYLYYPCDGLFQHRTVITDSAVIEIYDHDGYEIYPIAKVEIVTDSSFHLTLKTFEILSGEELGKESTSELRINI